MIEFFSIHNHKDNTNVLIFKMIFNIYTNETFEKISQLSN